MEDHTRRHQTLYYSKQAPRTATLWFHDLEVINLRRPLRKSFILLDSTREDVPQVAVPFLRRRKNVLDIEAAGGTGRGIVVADLLFAGREIFAEGRAVEEAVDCLRLVSLGWWCVSAAPLGVETVLTIMACFEDPSKGQVPVLANDCAVVGGIGVHVFVSSCIEGRGSFPFRGKTELLSTIPWAPGNNVSSIR